MTHANKLGMFIHWGIYSIIGEHEQIFAKFNIPREEYEAYAKQFNPTEYDPEEWVLLAKRAGMKYICFTAKHHDGFCMWDTKQTDYNIMNTPYGKDVLKMLAEACRKHGMLLSIYYSNPDWHHPCGYNSRSSHQDKAVNKGGEENTVEYREFVKAQITELLTGYGKIYTFFWDIPPGIYDPTLNELVRKLQPGIYINDRGWSEGDFSTPEREQTDINGTRFTRMTEACNSVGEQSWGYRKEEAFYSLRYLTSFIDRIMAMGGSYLLNVGPTEKGTISDEYRAAIEKVGDWYCRVADALECHEPDPYDYGVVNNRCIVTAKNGKSYFHFYDGIVSTSVVMKNPPSMPKSVKILNTGAHLPARIAPIPSSFNQCADCRNTPYLSITQIPTDELASEAIVIEIEW